jgi:hypothetical protein
MYELVLDTGRIAHLTYGRVDEGTRRGNSDGAGRLLGKTVVAGRGLRWRGAARARIGRGGYKVT